MSEQVVEEKEITLKVEGSGETREQALNTALSNIQKQVGGTPLRIEPLDVEVLEATEMRKTERFLFLFFPRIRSTYYLRLKVKIRIISIHLENITFQSQAEQSLFR